MLYPVADISKKTFHSYLLDNSLLLVETLLRSGLGHTARGTTELPGNLLTLGLRSVLLDTLTPGVAHLLGPLGTLLLSGVTLGHIFTLLLLDGLTLNNIVLNIVLMVPKKSSFNDKQDHDKHFFHLPGLTLRLVDSLTLLRSLAVTDQRGVAETDGLIKGNLLKLTN